MTTIELLRGGEVLASAQGEREAQLLYRGQYALGDELRFRTDDTHVIVQVDQAVKPARVYLPEKAFSYRLPLGGIDPAAYAPGAFTGDLHLCTVRPDEDNSYRNLARNPADQRGGVTCYPHATANVETRDESWFCARNTIDGEHIACGHGPWPFGSWGIGAREDAWCRIDFGREVTVDAMALILRADFPHDASWVSGHVVLSDGAEVAFDLQKTGERQIIPLGKHTVRWMRLERMQKSDDPSAFPALTEWEVYGCDKEGD